MKNKAIIKYNGGLLALLCSKCSVIIKTGKDFTKEELLTAKGKKHLISQYCDKCSTNKIL